MISIRPGRASGSPRSASTWADPVSRNCPGRGSVSTATLDRPEQPRSQLDLIDHHEPVVLDKASRIVLGSPQGGRIVQKADHGVWVLQGSDPGQGALADLPGAVKRDDTRIGQGLGHEALRPARYQITALIHLISMVRLGGQDGRMAAQHADTWPHRMWTSGRKFHGRLAVRRQPAARRWAG